MLSNFLILCRFSVGNLPASPLVQNNFNPLCCIDFITIILLVSHCKYTICNPEKKIYLILRLTGSAVCHAANDVASQDRKEIKILIISCPKATGRRGCLTAD